MTRARTCVKKGHLPAEFEGLRDAQKREAKRNEGREPDQNRLQSPNAVAFGRGGLGFDVVLERADARKKLRADGADPLAEVAHHAGEAEHEPRERIAPPKVLPVEGVEDEKKDRLQGDAHDVGHGRPLEVDVRVEAVAVLPDVTPIGALERQEQPREHQRDAVENKRGRPRARIEPVGNAAPEMFSDRMNRS